MGFTLVEDIHTRELMEAYLREYEKNHPQRRITKNNYKQTMVPEGSLSWTIITVQPRAYYGEER